MSNYTKATNFATKDTLPTGDSGKIVKGTEIDNEFNAISSAVSSKADTASPTFTGTPAAPTATAGSNTTQLATTAFVTGAVSDNNTTERTATATLTNKTISVDNNTISGIAASSFILSNSSGNIDGTVGQKVIPAGTVVGTSDTQTLTNKTLTSPTITSPSITSPTVTTPTITGTTTFGTSSLAEPSGSAPLYMCRAWVNFNGTGTVAIRASGNVSSITDNGTGNYTVNFTTAMPDADYAATGTARDPEGESTPMVFTPEASDTYSTTAFQFHTRSGAGSLVDVPTATVVVVR